MSPQLQAHRPLETSVVPEVSSREALNQALSANPPLPDSGRVVVGEGPVPAAIAFVGEQPGDEEDRMGRPFVGPAGHLLDRAMAEAGIDRSRVYLTNAVKQFKFIERGKRRIHQKPSMGEVTLYRWWLKRELDFVDPQIAVALGATAALALAGHRVTIAKARGPTEFDGRSGFVDGASILSAAHPGQRGAQDRL
jgi:uracil-DNA glycosylase family protein